MDINEAHLLTLALDNCFYIICLCNSWLCIYETIPNLQETANLTATDQVCPQLLLSMFVVYPQYNTLHTIEAQWLEKKSENFL